MRPLYKALVILSSGAILFWISFLVFRPDRVAFLIASIATILLGILINGVIHMGGPVYFIRLERKAGSIGYWFFVALFFAALLLSVLFAQRELNPFGF